MLFRPGPRNLITDVPGIAVGNADDARLASGVSVLLPDRPAVAAVDVRGGAPGTRETDAMALGSTVQEVHGLVLSGGSAFGLDAATGVQAFLRERGMGFRIGPVVIPVVPQAILFDLLNGGDKDWGRRPPYQDLAWLACERAGPEFALGTAGAGYGATTVNLKGGLGSASVVMPEGITIGALTAVNAVGSATIGDGRHFWAAPFEIGGEFGGCGWPAAIAAGALVPRFKGGPRENTTISIIATDAVLTRPEAWRLAVMAQDGLARALYPVHAPLDGDTVFVVSTGRRPLAEPALGLSRLGTLAANTLARAVARGVHAAAALPGHPLPDWRSRHKGA